jgi:hypothetical protein
MGNVVLFLRAMVPVFFRGCVARGGHGPPKVSRGPAIPCPSTPCGRVTPQNGFVAVSGWTACGCLLPVWTPHAIRLCRLLRWYSGGDFFLSTMCLRIIDKVAYLIMGNVVLFLRAMVPVFFVGVWRGVAMDPLKHHEGLPCPTLPRPAGRSPPKWPCCRFRVDGLWPSATPLDTPRRTPVPSSSMVF